MRINSIDYMKVIIINRILWLCFVIIAPLSEFSQRSNRVYAWKSRHWPSLSAGLCVQFFRLLSSNLSNCRYFISLLLLLANVGNQALFSPCLALSPIRFRCVRTTYTTRKPIRQHQMHTLLHRVARVIWWKRVRKTLHKRNLCCCCREIKSWVHELLLSTVHSAPRSAPWLSENRADFHAYPNKAAASNIIVAVELFE